MVKRNRICLIILAVLNIADLLITALVCYTDYLYKKFVFDADIIFINLICILIFDAFVILVMLQKAEKNKLKKAIIIILTIVFSVLTIYGSMVSLFIKTGFFWRSETDDFGSFVGVDDGLSLCIAGMNISDIIEANVGDVDDFYYMYESVFAANLFEVRGNFNFSNEKYEEIKKNFINSPEFAEARLSESDQQRTFVTGYFEYVDNILKSENGSNVYTFEHVIIRFNDDQKTIYFHLKGNIDK